MPRRLAFRRPAVTPGYTWHGVIFELLAEVDADGAGDAPDQADCIELDFLSVFQLFGPFLLQKGDHVLALILAKGNALVMIVGGKLEKLLNLQVRCNFSHLSSGRRSIDIRTPSPILHEVGRCPTRFQGVCSKIKWLLLRLDACGFLFVRLEVLFCCRHEKEDDADKSNKQHDENNE
jgi:hypothetical protein